MKRATISPLSVVPSASTSTALERTQAVCLSLVLLLGGVTLAGWMVPPLEGILPSVFKLMRANTALLIFLSGLALDRGKAGRSRTAVSASQLMGLFVALFAALILLKDFGLISLRIETLLAADATSIYPGKVSPEAACVFILIGIVLAGLRARKSLLSHLIDLTLLLLSLAMLVFVARYLFGLSHLFILLQNNPFSVQTLVCLALLTFLVGSRRAEYGLFAILLDSGNGGMIARLAVPMAVLLPFVIAVPKALLVRMHPEQDNAFTATATSLLSIGAVCMVLLLAWRTKAFESTVQDLSLRDELTGLYNRRGFNLLAEQVFELARRAQEPFSVIFLDMDNLKHVNDTLGHDAGSELLKEMSSVLAETFRQTDVIGRLGGDEFVVAGRSTAEEAATMIQRLHEMTAQTNAEPNRKYVLSFSLGFSVEEGGSETTLQEMLTKADAMMYENKRSKRTRRA